MKKLSHLIAAGAAMLAVPALADDTLPPGIWTNTEDAYFAEEEGRQEADWVGIEVGDDGGWRMIDAFGAALSDWSTAPIPGLSPREEGGWQLGASELRKARAMSCWVSVKKFAGKPNGDEDWTYANNLKVFDQGGRVAIAGEGLAPDVTVRVRNVTWAKGSPNKPSLVLYIHKDDPVRAESYSWAAPDANLIGVNLRWVQASCSREES